MPENNSNDENSPQEKSPEGLGFLQTLLSVFAAMFGIQTQEKHQRDFEQGSATNFIFVGIVVTLVFIITLFMLVSYLIDNAGV